MIELTDRAKEALAAASAAAGRFNPDARIRLSLRDGELRAELSDGLEPNDRLVEFSGLTLIVQDGIEGSIDAGEHNVLSIRPV